jgi:hypothetical protein
MKKILFLLLTTSSIMSAQETQFTFNKAGLTDYIITEVPNKTQAEIYLKVINWIKTTYKNPESVIVSEIKDQYVKINGATSGITTYRIMGLPYFTSNKYTIEISVKEGKYKFDVIELQFYNEPSKYTAGGWGNYAISGDITNVYYKKSGEVKAIHKTAETEVPKYFNNLNKSLLDYINSNEVTNSKIDW